MAENLQVTVVAGRPTVPACDVSRWQGGIDYSVFDLPAVVTKLTGGDGGKYVDSRGYENVSGFLATGHAVGTYHYAGRGDPVDEANWYVDHLLDSAWADAPQAQKLPPTGDFEWTNPHMPAAQGADFATRFLGRCGDRTGMTPWNYTAGWVGMAADPALLAFPLWLAAYVPADQLWRYPCPPYTNHQVWQWSSSGSVAGVAGRCDTDAIDLDLFTEVTGRSHDGAHAPEPVPSPIPKEYDLMRLVVHVADGDLWYVWNPGSGIEQVSQANAGDVINSGLAVTGAALERDAAWVASIQKLAA